MNCDLKDAKECIKKLKKEGWKNYFEIVLRALRLIIEKNIKRDQRRELVKLLCQLKSDKVLIRQDFDQGIEFILMNLPDLSIDCPNAVAYVAEMIANWYMENCTSLHFFESGMDNFKDTKGMTLKFVGYFLKTLKLKKDEGFAIEIYEKASLEKFVEGRSISSLLKSRSLPP